MNVRRYTCAAMISLGAHAALVSQFDEQKAFAMPAGTQASAISLQFVKAASPSAATNEPVQKSAENTRLESPATKPEPKQPTTKATSPAQPKITKSATNKKTSTTKTPIDKTPTSNNTIAKKTEIVKAQAKEKRVEPAIEKQLSQASSAKQGVSEKPILIEQPSFLSPPTTPRYPRLAQRRGIEGTAMYEIWLDENGQQIKQNLLSSSGASMLDQAALEAIKQWKFSPRKINGTSIAHRVQVPIRFKLD